jgi:hypothetical protein
MAGGAIQLAHQLKKEKQKKKRGKNATIIG